MIVRLAQPGEGRAVARLIREALPGSLRALSIWRSPKVHVYVEDCLRQPGPTTPVFCVLASSRNETVGAAQYQRCDDGAFLSHICVAPAHCGRGLGSRLLREGSEPFLDGRRRAMLRLDVDPLNQRAAAWYCRLGFRPIANTIWQVGDLAHSPGVGIFSGMAEAESMQQRFGFSRFQLATAYGRYTIGRLPAPYFCLENPQALSDNAVHGSLSRLAARNRFLLRATKPVEGLDIVHSAQRLEVAWETLAERLTERGRLLGAMNVG